MEHFSTKGKKESGISNKENIQKENNSTTSQNGIQMKINDY